MHASRAYQIASTECTRDIFKGIMNGVREESQEGMFDLYLGRYEDQEPNHYRFFKISQRIKYDGDYLAKDKYYMILRRLSELGYHITTNSDGGVILDWGDENKDRS